MSRQEAKPGSAEPGGVRRWLTTTNHKDIGTMYLVLALVMLFVAGAMAMLIRAELFAPGLQILQPHTYNEMVSMHGFLMIFAVIVPAWVGIANWQIPLMLGASDMAFPRINNFSFWLLPAAFSLMLGSLLVEGASPDFGWTGYAPLSSHYSSATAVYVFTIHLTSISSILAAINVLATVFNMRAPSIGFRNLPLFVWAWVVTAFLLLPAMSVLSAAATMLLTDRYFGTGFFDAAGGGSPVLFQHLFWFFGHPEVYVMILPAFGVISHIVESFSRKRIFGYTFLVYSLLAIGMLSLVVWSHHMFTVGMPVAGEVFFMASTMLIAVPTGIKVFNWIATMWRGAMTFETPMLFALGFIVMFVVGGLSGVMLAVVPADFQYHDTYFVVAHLHYVVVSGALFGLFAAVYYWLPKWSGRMYSERLGRWHFWLSTLFMNVTFFPMHFLGLAGMPRRISDYSLQFSTLNSAASIGAFGFGLSQLIFVYLLLQASRRGVPAPARPWEGARGLEWTLSSPPPRHSFMDEPPVVPARDTAG